MSKLVKDIQALFDSFREDELRIAEEAVQEFHDLLLLCGSPVEQMLLFEFKTVFDGHVVDGLEHDRSKLVGTLIFPGVEWAHINIYPQYPIPLEGKNCTADFMFEIADWRSGRRTVHFRLVVEVDGHDYHEKTKEQARHDKQRDRAMMKTGVYILRFTGSEIYRDAIEAATEVEQFLIDRVQAIK